METSSFCLAQADKCALAAGETNLPNVREQLERARNAWLSLAETARLVVEARAQRGSQGYVVASEER